MASIRVKPMHAAKNVCPTPQNNAYSGAICKLEALYTKATAALLTTPDVNGDKTPITRMKMGKNFPNLCFLSVAKAMAAAIT